MVSHEKRMLGFFSHEKRKLGCFFLSCLLMIYCFYASLDKMSGTYFAITMSFFIFLNQLPLAPRL